MTTRLSKSAYARRRGVTEGAVRQAIKSGRISIGDDGKIDPDLADVEWQKNTLKANYPDNAVTTSSDKSDVNPAKAANYQQAKTAHEVLKAQTAKVNLDKLKGSLIDRDKALAHVFKLARSERDSWLNFPARVSAELASKLNADENQVYSLLTEYITRHLKELSELKPRLE